MVGSRAGVTPPSMFGVFMNLSWYESNGAVPVPELKRWVWIPRELQKQGYHTVFISTNPMMELYRDTFSRGFVDYDVKSAFRYEVHNMVDKIQEIYNTVNRPKYIFLLLMETHQPYLYKKHHTEEYLNAKYHPITNQIKALEAIDRDFGRLTRFLEGTNTDLLIFSDHGDLDLKIEGAQGHGPSKFHPKLFEIPYGRKTL
jgi:hypothetical protein